MNEEFVIGRSFGTADYIVFGALIAISIAIGIFFAIKDKRHNTSVNYFLGDRKLKSFPLGLSFVATFLSSITMLGSPAEVYVYGLQYAMQIIGIMGSLYLASAIVVPLLHPLKLTSVYEYYQLRYGTKSVRCLGVVLGVSYYTLYMGIVLFGTALALQSTTALPIWISVVTFAAAATLYTSIGGIKAVIWTDVFQSFVMLGGILAALIAFVLSNVKGPLGEIFAGFTGAVAGPQTGMFLVSVFFRRSRPKAVFFATCVSRWSFGNTLACQSRGPDPGIGNFGDALECLPPNIKACTDSSP
ncbi:sodium-dependent multivitamin transporter-like [Mercenaria mercenaria]|uniref:sodium-dependent multivitamin transporter-like n=1 Tax=Mercenaria mercenaria TaxID=6596 RepID=UPI001E1D8E94|nr:sodium-dependent multivitamin transporter-like [Mercenaria mercenaria]